MIAKHTKRLEQDHRLLAVWASDCAEHVLAYFDETHPDDDRPRKAIEAARAWVRGDLSMIDARKAAFASHAAAREAHNAAAQAAARAAGHAAATAHVADHARHAAAYAVKAVTAAEIGNNATATESDWQYQHLPKHLRSVAFPTLRQMNTYIALFRGINVGGNSSLPMKELVAILEGIGARKVKTYIQSGNAVFQSAEKSPAQLSKQLAAEIKKRHGFEPYILILGLEAIKKAIAENPFPEAETDPSSLHLGFLASKPKSPDLEKLSSLKKKSERFHLRDGVFYLHAPEGVGRSKLAASTEKLLGVPMTDRNWRTVCKVMEMAGE